MSGSYLSQLFSLGPPRSPNTIPFHLQVLSLFFGCEPSLQWLSYLSSSSLCCINYPPSPL